MVGQAADSFQKGQGNKRIEHEKSGRSRSFRRWKEVEAVYAASFCFLARVLGSGFSAFSGFSTAS